MAGFRADSMALLSALTPIALLRGWKQGAVGRWEVLTRCFGEGKGP